MKHIKTLEFWKDIPGYEGLYQVSNWGRIKSLARGGRGRNAIDYIMTYFGTDKDGYKTVVLTKDGKGHIKKVHRLVAMAFLPNPEELPCIDHINQRRHDNRVCNLQWISAAQNTIKDCGKKPRCVETKKWYVSLSEAQRQTGIDRRSISRCCEGQQKTAGKLHWEWC